MIRIKINLLGVLKLAVIPKLKPTVLYAEKHSKATATALFSGSKIKIPIIPAPITIKDSAIIANALLTELSEISLR